jgi:hypothetical protein
MKASCSGYKSSELSFEWSLEKKSLLLDSEGDVAADFTPEEDYLINGNLGSKLGI